MLPFECVKDHRREAKEERRKDGTAPLSICGGGRAASEV